MKYDIEELQVEHTIEYHITRCTYQGFTDRTSLRVSEAMRSMLLSSLLQYNKTHKSKIGVTRYLTGNIHYVVNEMLDSVAITKQHGKMFEFDNLNATPAIDRLSNSRPPLITHKIDGVSKTGLLHYYTLAEREVSILEQVKDILGLLTIAETIRFLLYRMYTDTKFYEIVRPFLFDLLITHYFEVMGHYLRLYELDAWLK